ncbi:MAG: hypothetical protein GYA14_08345, partial [Ignavibacteria bacterium]|nr:hypothetical protein [Ignavibacteria bacterium]
MKKAILIIPLLILLFQNQNYSQISKPIFVKFKIIVRDEYLKPLKNNLVFCTIYNREDKTNQAQIIKEQEYTTNEFGELLDSVKLINKEDSHWYYGSIYYFVKNESYCLSRGKKIISKYGKNVSDLNKIVEITIDLIKPVPVIHSIRFIVQNRLKIPLENASIIISKTVSNGKLEKDYLITDSLGKANTNIIYEKGFDLCDEKQRNGISTLINYSIEKTDYFKYSGEKEISLNSTKLEEITLIHPSDYFDKDFWRLHKYSSLREKVHSILDLIMLQSLLKDCILKYDFINIEKFKEKNYISFGFDELNTYNSIKLSQYDIAKTLFDEIIRKMLSHLNMFLSGIKEIDGYNLQITTATKNFLDKN